MKITELRSIIDDATAIFAEKYSFVKIPKIEICPSSKRRETRERVLLECGAVKKDLFGTIAEVISGSLETRILVYQSMAKTRDTVLNAVWHEFGHIMVGDHLQFGIDTEVDTPERSGYALANEFLAQYVSYAVNDFEQHDCMFEPHDYLEMAFRNGLIPYWLSLFFAVLLGDKSLPEDYAERCMNLFEEEARCFMTAIYYALSKQISKPEYWKMDRDFLTELGEYVDELYYLSI